MEIYLVRHGAPYTHEEDPERHLNNKGIKQSHIAGKALKKLGVNLDQIISSPKARARQTAEIIAEEVGYQKGLIEITKTLEPNSPAKDVIAYLNKFADKKRVLLAGHLPSLGYITSELTCGKAYVSVHFEVCNICRVDVDQIQNSTGELCWFLTQEHLNYIAQS